VWRTGLGSAYSLSALNIWRANFGATSGAPADFNNDGIVNSANHVVWQKGFGTTYIQSAYDPWRLYFG